VATTQATTTTMHREQETLITAVAAARKTLDKARTHKRATTLAWEKEKTTPVTWNSSSPLPKGSRSPRTIT
jgi:hypothetical protein